MLTGQDASEKRQWGAHCGKIINNMERTLPKVTYQGYRIGEGWEAVVERPGQQLRLLDVPQRKGEWAMNLLTDYLGDERRAADLHLRFRRAYHPPIHRRLGTERKDIDEALTEVEILRARWRIALARG